MIPSLILNLSDDNLSILYLNHLDHYESIVVNIKLKYKSVALHLSGTCRIYIANYKLVR